MHLDSSEISYLAFNFFVIKEPGKVYRHVIRYMSSVPIKPGDDKPRRLTNLEKSQFSLSEPLKEILVGSLLGFYFLFQRK